MAERTPGNDPLGDRLRATFQEEHAALERSQSLRGPVPSRSRVSTAWIPMVAAAAVLVVAGFLLLGTRADNQAQELDLAGQPGQADPGTDTSGTEDDLVAAMVSPVPTLAEPTKPPAEADPTPTPSPASALPVGGDGEDPTSANSCAEGVDGDLPWFVWGILPDDPDGGLVGHSAPGIDEPVTRILELDEVVTRTGACDLSAARTPWFQLVFGSETDWASGRYLAKAEPACLIGEQFGTWTRADLDRPDSDFEPFFYTVEKGDRLNSIATKFNVPVEALLAANPGVDPNLLIGGTLLRVPGAGRQQMVGPLDGHAVFDRGDIAFAPANSSRYRWYPAGAATPGPCADAPSESFPDDLAQRPCAIDGSTPEQSSGSAGFASSEADHVHNLRVESGQSCTRVVIEFGAGAWSDDDRPAALVPPVRVTKVGASSELRFDPCLEGPQFCAYFSSSQGEPQRVDFASGSVFIAIDDQRQPYVRILASGQRSSITIMENPARIVVDIEPVAAQRPRWIPGAIFSDSAILTTPIVRDTGFPVVAADTPIVVDGYARPFEAIGSWYVFAATADGELPDRLGAIASGTMQTTGWAEGWGEFSVNLPGLPPGNYMALFGSAGSSGEYVFRGSGQWFTVLGPDDDRVAATADFPDPTKLDVRINQPIAVVD